MDSVDFVTNLGSVLRYSWNLRTCDYKMFSFLWNQGLICLKVWLFSSIVAKHLWPDFVWTWLSLLVFGKVNSFLGNCKNRQWRPFDFILFFDGGFFFMISSLNALEFLGFKLYHWHFLDLGSLKWVSQLATNIH